MTFIFTKPIKTVAQLSAYEENCSTFSAVNIIITIGCCIQQITGEKKKVSVTVIKQRLEYHIYVNFSVQNLLYLTCTTHGMPNFLLVCGSVWVQLDMSPRKACQSIKKFHLFSFLIFWQKYHNTPLQWKFSKIKISAKAGKAIFQWLLIWLGKMIQSPFLKSNI